MKKVRHLWYICDEINLNYIKTPGVNLNHLTNANVVIILKQRGFLCFRKYNWL